jgi:hypothetical protein
MAADEARQLTFGAQTSDVAQAGVMVSCWHHAIRKAAAQGLTSVRYSDVDRPRAPISASAHKLAHAQLRADGFTVRTVQTGPNEYDDEVSW